MKILFQKTTAIKNPVSAEWHSHAYWQMDHSPDIRKIKVSLEDKTISLSPSELLLIPPYRGHKIVVPSAGIYRNMKFEAEGFAAPGRGAFTVSIGNFKNIANEIFSGIDRDDGVSKSVNEKLMEALLISLGLNKGNRAPGKKTLSKRIADAVNYMESVSFSGLKLEKTAGKAGLSMNHFIREFTREAGITPMRYFRRRRMEKALELLRYSDFNLSQIADALEFPDLHRFSRAFKNEFGLSPGNYRKKLPGK